MSHLVAVRRLLCLVPLLAAPSHVHAQGGASPDGRDTMSVLARETYLRPPAAIERLVLAPRQLNVGVANQSPTRRHFLKLDTDGLPSTQLFGKPWYNLAGLQIDPKGNRARVLT